MCHSFIKGNLLLQQQLQGGAGGKRKISHELFLEHGLIPAMF